ncbi:ORF36 [macacine gammaherpesvirus 12]|uniref:ORF36 n=1 Tax=macacine gammaherpesvirus 12 TaxID=2560571 RepID=A0A0B5CYE7_9GAMA|nr:ORF36 [Macaca nemestrina rhadinovirus 2]AJE29679.1 ORF36 [Macaca nemestrina rhadinovirus 2]
MNLFPWKKSPQKTTLLDGNWSVCPECAPKALDPIPKVHSDIEKAAASHITVIRTRKTLAQLKIPSDWCQCSHRATDWTAVLGRGSYGVVRSMSLGRCVKHFGSRREFFYECIFNDIVRACRERYPRNRGGDRILCFLEPCVPCRALIFPQLTGNLLNADLKHVDPERLAVEFSELKEGVRFLNNMCGIVHCDISPENILIKGELTTAYGRLMIGDLGSASLHTGTPWTGVMVTSKLGFVQHTYHFKTPAKFLCKHIYRPSCLLYRCLLSCTGGPRALVLDQPFQITPQLGLTIDISSLGYSLLACLEKYLQPADPFPQQGALAGASSESAHPLFYLSCMVPRVVIAEIFSRAWDIPLDLGIDSSGSAPAIPLRESYRRVFADQCSLYRAQFKEDALENASSRLCGSKLKLVLQKLLVRDYFSHCGNCGDHGFFFR